MNQVTFEYKTCSLVKWSFGMIDWFKLSSFSPNIGLKVLSLTKGSLKKKFEICHQPGRRGQRVVLSPTEKNKAFEVQN